MPKCNCRTAECVIGNFYCCKTPGCENGPPRARRPPVEPEVTIEWDTPDNFRTPTLPGPYGLQLLRVCPALASVAGTCEPIDPPLVQYPDHCRWCLKRMP